MIYIYVYIYLKTKHATVPPKIAPFEFSHDVNFGERASVQCVVGTGDLPLTFSWIKDQIPLSMDGSGISHDMQRFHDEIKDSITIRQNDEFSSSLSITKVTSLHNGNYSCLVENVADKVLHSAQLRVNGK